jgi:transcriptional regulator GlxA family with amidase domain
MPTRRIAIVTFDGAQSLDVTGPLETFAIAAAIAAERTPRAPRAYHVELLAARPGPVRMNSGLRLVADRAYGNVQSGIDTLVVSGGDVAAAARDVVLRRWLVGMAGRVRRLASVCSGSFILAEAGLLDGRRATTHWAGVSLMTRRYPRITVEPDAIFVRDGTVYTSAGVTAGIDLALALVEEDLGRGLALAVARELVVFLKRPGGQAQFSATLALQQGDARFERLHAWIADNLSRDLSVASLADVAGMSERSFVRHYRQATGRTPARAVEQVRVEAARHLLERGRPVKRVAAHCGYGSEETMRRSFLRLLGATPQAYRERFSVATRQ